MAFLVAPDIKWLKPYYNVQCNEIKWNKNFMQKKQQNFMIMHIRKPENEIVSEPKHHKKIDVKWV